MFGYEIITPTFLIFGCMVSFLSEQEFTPVLMHPTLFSGIR